MVLIKPRDPHWLHRLAPEKDLCLHGGVEVRAAGLTLSAGDDTDLAITAAALYLLRTLSADHTQEHPVGGQDQSLIPCCGHAMFADQSSLDVLIIGCPYGVDWEVRRQGGAVNLKTQLGAEVTVPFDEWRRAVVDLADAVEAFYASSEPKRPHDDDQAAGYAAFWAEFRRRRDAAR